MERPERYQRGVNNNQFGNNITLSQDDNTVNLYNFQLHQRPVRAAIRVIPYPLNEELVHRPDLIDKLNTLLPQTSSTYYSAALWGLGGSGKTQIALNYAYQRCIRTSCSVFWVHADSEATFSQDYRTIARQFGIDERLKSEELLEAVRDQIAAQSEWVLILDNADDLKLFGVGQTQEQTKNLLQYIPQAPTGTVLWTSRDAHIAGTLVGPGRGIEVARMGYDEAEKLLAIARSTNTSNQEIREETEIAALLEELQRLPLAITQAGAYMRRTSISAKEYSSLLAQSKQRWDILKVNEFDRHRRFSVPNNVLETWGISIDRLRQESKTAYRILHVIAYVSNQNIPHEIITTTLKHCCRSLKEQSGELEAEAAKAIARLKEFSFIGIHQMEDGSKNYEVHKLVQEATRYGLRVWKPSILKRFISKKEGEKYFSSMALQVIDDLFPESEQETWTQCEKYLTHAVQIGDWADLSGKQIETAYLLGRVSNYLDDRGRWREEQLVDERALELQRKIRGEKHPDTLTAKRRLAATYYEQGRYSEAEAIEVQVLSLYQEILGKEHPDTLAAMQSLASTYYQQGRYNEAEAIEVQVLSLRQGILEKEHPDTLAAMHNLAITYSEKGLYSKAEAIQVQVLSIRQEILGKEHPDTLVAMQSLAIIYYQQGRYNEAEAIEVQVLSLRQGILGKEHPDTLAAMSNLAYTWDSQGRHHDALALMQECLQSRLSILGPEHPDTVGSAKALERWKSRPDNSDRSGDEELQSRFEEQ